MECWYDIKDVIEPIINMCTGCNTLAEANLLECKRCFFSDNKFDKSTIRCKVMALWEKLFVKMQFSMMSLLGACVTQWWTCEYRYSFNWGVILCIRGLCCKYQRFNRTDYYFWLVVPITTTAARIWDWVDVASPNFPNSVPSWPYLWVFINITTVTFTCDTTYK